jgi:hypothetical protein
MTIAPTEFEELGLDPPTCKKLLPKRNRMCGQDAIGTTERCIYHGGRLLDSKQSIVEFRKEMADAIVPVAMQRLWDIIMDEKATHTDVIRAAFGIMDRVGLGPVQGLQIDANVRTEAPLQAIQQLLNRVADRLPPTGEDEEILDAEVLD